MADTTKPLSAEEMLFILPEVAKWCRKEEQEHKDEAAKHEARSTPAQNLTQLAWIDGRWGAAVEQAVVILETICHPGLVQITRKNATAATVAMMLPNNYDRPYYEGRTVMEALLKAHEALQASETTKEAASDAETSL